MNCVINWVSEFEQTKHESPKNSIQNEDNERELKPNLKVLCDTEIIQIVVNSNVYSMYCCSLSTLQLPLSIGISFMWTCYDCRITFIISDQIHFQFLFFGYSVKPQALFYYTVPFFFSHILFSSPIVTLFCLWLPLLWICFHFCFSSFYRSHFIWWTLNIEHVRIQNNPVCKVIKYCAKSENSIWCKYLCVVCFNWIWRIDQIVIAHSVWPPHKAHIFYSQKRKKKNENNFNENKKIRLFRKLKFRLKRKKSSLGWCVFNYFMYIWMV